MENKEHNQRRRSSTTGEEKLPNGTSIEVCHINEGFEEDHGEDIILPAITKRMSIDNCSDIDVPENGQIAKYKKTCRVHIEGDPSSGGAISRNGHTYDDNAPPVIQKRPKAAVTVRNAVKCYGSGPEILKHFSMTIPKGTIYSLLGSSGCGKTTLLSCIVGIKHLNSGEILVFGAKPGTKESGIPGKRVGYMPQELSLYNDFSISESMMYFGTIYSMTKEEIATSRDFLISFLDLPDHSRRIGTLSGGQKRRVSLAVALIHSPELLILDEPTVGVDPLLRESIWSHLKKLVSSQETTVLITTHYVEEARGSNTVGLMRGGRLIAEKSPELLLKEHNTVLLEEIVLKLCRKDVFGVAEDIEELQHAMKALDDVYDVDFVPYSKNRRSSMPPVGGRRRMSMLVMEKMEEQMDIFNVLNRLKALIRKNWVVMTRNLILLLFMIIVPSVQILLICTAIGNDPKPMWLGVVNYDTNDTLCQNIGISHEGCDVENLSCKFISKLPKDTIYLKAYPDQDAARDGIRAGDIWGSMTFPHGYSDNVYTRSSSGNIIDNETLEGSNIFMEMDLTNKQISGPLKKVLYDGYKEFVRDLLVNCGFHPELAESPIKYLEPVYGTDDTDFREFVAPSVLLGFLFFFPLCSSGVSYIWDKKQGTLERARVAGINTWELMVAFFITEGAILLLQTGISFCIIVFLFGIEVKGSSILVMSLNILMGLGGVSMGFLISSFCNEEIEAVMLAMAAFFPNFLLSGMLWPTEGMPLGLQYVAYLLPCTLAGESVRSIISRGWGFTHIKVWPGFVTTFIWICVYWIVTICIHKIVLARK